MAQQDLVALEKKLLEKEERLDAEKQKIEGLRDKLEEQLEKVSSLTPQEARDELLALVEGKEAKAAAKII